MLTPAFTTGDDYGPAPRDEWHACGYEEWHESGSYGDTRLVPAFAVAPVVAVVADEPRPARAGRRPVPVSRRTRTGFGRADARRAGGRGTVQPAARGAAVAARPSGRGPAPAPARSGSDRSAAARSRSDRPDPETLPARSPPALRTGRTTRRAWTADPATAAARGRTLGP